MYFTVSGDGDGELASAGDIFTAGTFYEVTSTPFSWVFKATEVGQVEYKFFVINNSGLEIEKSVQLNITEIPEDDFTFTAISTSNSEVVDTSVPINFNINETVGNSTYKLSFTTNKSAVLIYEGNEYLQGDLIDVTAGNFSASYKGLNGGQHNILFSVQNANTVPTVKTAEEIINFSNIDFEVATNGAGLLFINQSKPFNLFLS